MLNLEETIGTPEQEELMLIAAGIIEQYLREKTGKKIGTDYLQILGTGRKSMKKVLDTPIKDLADYPRMKKHEIVKKILIDVIVYYDLQNKQDEMLDTFFKLYNEWEKEYRPKDIK